MNKAWWKRLIVGHHGEMLSLTKGEDDYPVSNAQYTIEYLREDQVEYVEQANKTGWSCEPWELRDTYVTNSPTLAFSQYALLLCREDVAEVYCYIDEGATETAVYEVSTIRHSIRSAVNADLNKTVAELHATLHETEVQCTLAMEFIKKFHAEKEFATFCNERRNRK